MNIVYPAFIRIPTEKAHGAQIMKTCEAFANEGVEVELVVPGRRTHIQEDPFDYYGTRKNFTFTILKTPDWTPWGALGFVLSALWFSEVVKLQKRFWKADIIYSRDAFVLMQYIFLGRKLVYEAHTKPTWISTFVAKRAHHVIVISEGLKEVYRKRGIPEDRLTVAHDAVDIEVFKKEYSQRGSLEWLGIPQDKRIALYVGRIDMAKGTETFAATSEYVPNDTLCVLIGSGPIKEDLQKRYPKAVFLPETPYRDLPRVLAAADVLVLPNSSKDENAAKYTSPLKAFAYLAAKKPIIASDVPALHSILGNSAVYVPADDPSALAEALSHPHTVEIVSVGQIPTWTSRAQKIVQVLEGHCKIHY